MPLSAIDSIGPAFEHAKQQLLRPFRVAQWAKLALVGFLAGELTSGGCSSTNFHPNVNVPAHSGTERFLALPSLPPLDPAVYAALIATVVVAAIILWVLFAYVSSVMRFVLFDSIIARHCEIGRSWNGRQAAGVRLFIWNLVISFSFFTLLAIIVGVPAAAAFGAGWLNKAGQHVGPLILLGMFVFLFAAALVVTGVVVHVFTKDFVVPQMALEDISAFEGWRRLLPMLDSEKGGYAGYAGMKLVLAIAAAVVIGIVATIIIVIMMIPAVGLGVGVVFAGKAAGITWNLFTITFAVMAAVAVVMLILYAVSLVSVPAIVFFPAYGLYFFASRYPALHALLYPPPPEPSPPVPPAFPPVTPEPIGP